MRQSAGTEYIFVTFVINSYCIDQICILLNKLHNLKIIEE